MPAEQLEQQRSLLLGLVERPPLASGENRKVNRLSTVRLGSARYSVPARLRGTVMQMLVDCDEVRVLREGARLPSTGCSRQAAPPSRTSTTRLRRREASAHCVRAIRLRCASSTSARWPSATRAQPPRLAPNVYVCSDSGCSSWYAAAAARP